jgi:hypothetical protein
MNYIVEINLFYDWLETNRLSDAAINLWHALMHVNNKTTWKQEFAVAISTLELKTSLSKSSIIRARNSLQQAGRINFRSREGQQSAIYTIIAFQSETQSGTQSSTQSATQTGTQTATQSVTISKLKETKPNKKKQRVQPQPPSLNEVIEYFKDNGYNEEIARKAFNHYAVADWKDKNGKKVMNWKQKMNTVWFGDEGKLPAPGESLQMFASNGRPLTPYEMDYERKKAEAVERIRQRQLTTQ